MPGNIKAVLDSLPAAEPYSDSVLKESRETTVNSVLNSLPGRDELEETGLINYFKQKWQVGQSSVIRGSYADQAKKGLVDEGVAFGESDKATSDYVEFAQRDKTTWRTPFKRGVGEVVELLPFMVGAGVESIEGALKGAIVGGTAAFVAGAAIPLDEFATTPAAALAGGRIGAAYHIIDYSRKIEGGNIYRDLREQGISKETSYAVSEVAGIAIGIVETMQLHLAGVAGKKTFIKAMQTPSVRQALVKSLVSYAQIAGGEIMEEEIQDAISLVAFALAGTVEGKEDIIPTKQEVIKSLLTTLQTAGPGMALLALPGALIGGVGGAAQARSAARQRIIDKALAEIKDKDIKISEPQKDISAKMDLGVEVEPDVERQQQILADAKIRKEAMAGKKEPTGEGITPTEGKVAEGVTPAKIEITKESIKPDISGIAPIQHQIQAMEDRKARADAAEYALDEIDSIRKAFKNRIQRFEKEFLKEELEAIPKYYITKEGGIKPDEAIEMLREQFNVDLVDESALADYFQDLDASRKALLEEIEAERPGFITKRETTLLRDKIKAAEQGIREGRVKTKDEIKSVQSELIGMIEQAKLEAKDRAKFLRALKNVQTKEDLSKTLPTIIDRLMKLREAAERKDLITEIKDLTKPSELKGLRPEFRKQIEPLFADIDFVKRTQGKIKGLNKLAEFVANNPDNQIPQKRLDELRILEGKPIDEVSTEALQLILDSVRNFIKQNELKNKLIIKGKLRQKEVVVDQAIKNVQSRPAAKPNSITGLDSFQQNEEAKVFKKIFGVDSYNAELKCEILDGKDFDIINEVVYGGIDKGVDTKLEFEFTAKDFFKEKFGDINIDSWSKVFQTKAKNIEKVKAGKFTMTKAERVSFILHSRNIQSEKHMVEGGVSFAETPQKIIKIGPGDIGEIVASATSEELKIADTLSEYFNTIQKERINEVSTPHHGRDAPQKLKWSYYRGCFCCDI